LFIGDATQCTDESGALQTPIASLPASNRYVCV